MKVGVVGCGAIGSEICRAIDRGIEGVELVALHDRNRELALSLSNSLACMPRVVTIDEMIPAVDFVVESASQSAVRDIVPQVLAKGRSVLVMSGGAMTDEKLREKLVSIARGNGCKLYMPSGAIAGLDGLKAASVSRIDSVTLTTSKPPAALAGAPYLEERGIDVGYIRGPGLLYEGDAASAVRAFPANVNVAAALSLAGVGTENTKVRIVADPSLKRNVHEILVTGEFGRLYVKVENVPSPTNPKTSYLAALSAIATLKRIAQPLQIGT